MNRKLRAIIPALALLAGLLCMPSASALVLTPDTITVGTVTTNSATVDVPVYIRDASGTPLGIDQPAGSRIQSYSIKVTFSPAASVASATFSRAGITSALTPSFSTSPQTPGSISLIETYQESTNPIPFTLNGAVPGNQVAHLVVHLSAAATIGSTITLTLDPTLTQLANDTGTTTESTANSNLGLVNGSITVGPSYIFDVPTMSSWAFALLAVALALVALRMRA